MIDPGYGFVPLTPTVRRVVRPEACWDRRVPGTLAGTIAITLTAEQPVHVGSGSKEARDLHVIQRAARVRGGPGIPGASLKGVLRARYEAITRSCAGPPPRGTFKVRSSSTTLERGRLLPAAARAAVFEHGAQTCTPKLPCPGCALFGRMSLRSRITVTDLAGSADTGLVLASIPDRFGPNLHHVGPWDFDASGTVAEVRALHGRKFGRGRGPATEHRQRIEAIPAGARLNGELRVWNVTPVELGGLLAALGCDPPSALKLGGGKAHGFGRVHVRERCQLDAAGSASLDPAEWRRQFIGSADYWRDGEHGLVELHRGDC